MAGNGQFCWRSRAAAGFLAGLMVSGAAMGVALPAAPVLATGEAARSFRDVDGHWAEQAIARMAAKGVVQGVRRAGGDYFEPERPVTRYEAIVALVRVLGLEGLAGARQEAGEDGGVAGAPDWARGYLAVAAERGILSASERAAFRGQEPAPRMQVAGWVVRALGLEPEARRAAGAPFGDLQLVGPEWRGYIAVAADAGLMLGSQGRFRPFDSVKRGELAMLLARLDRLLANDLDAGEVAGIVAAVYARSVTVATEEGERSLPLADQALLFFDGRRVPEGVGTAILQPGDRVEAVIDELGRAAYLEALGQAREVSGEIGSLLRVGEDRVMRVAGPRGEEEVRLTPEAVILLNELPAGWSSLRQGQSVRVLAQGRKALRVSARSRVEQVRGQIQSVVLQARGSAVVTVKVSAPEGEAERVFELPAGLALTRNGELVSFSALAVKDILTLTLRDGAVVRGRAEAYARSVSGLLKAIRYGEPPVLVLDLREGTRWAAQDEAKLEASFSVPPSAQIKRDGLEAGVTALRPGDSVEVSLEGDAAVRVEARTRTASFTGTLLSITIAQPTTLSVRLASGQEAVYRVSRDVEVRVGSGQASLLSLKPGMRVDLSVTPDGTVVAVRAAEGGLRDDLRGVVRYVDARENRAVVELGDGSVRQVRPASGFLVYRDGQLRDRVSALRTGDVVIAVGKDVPGEPFLAEIIVVLGRAQ